VSHLNGILPLDCNQQKILELYVEKYQASLHHDFSITPNPINWWACAKVYSIFVFVKHINRTHGATVARQIPVRSLLKVIRSNRVGFNTLQYLFFPL
jgi:hypothetical protein